MSNRHPPTPPRLARRLLRHLVAPQRLEALEGDLDEQFQHQLRTRGPLTAHLTFWRDVLLAAAYPRLRHHDRPSYHQASTLDMLRNYLKIALRTLKRHAGYTCINVAGLAVGLACCLLILLFVQHELSYDRFHEKADRLFRVTRGSQHAILTTPSNVKFKLEPAFPEIEHLVRIINMSKWGSVVVHHDGLQFNESRLLYADPAFFDLFSYSFLGGSPETALDRPYTIVLTRSMAEKYFGEDDPLGQTVTINNNRDFEVTGVMENVPAHTHLPFDFVASMASLDWTQEPDWGAGNFATYALLRDAADAAVLQQKIPDLIRREVGEDLAREPRFQIGLQPVTAIHLQSDTDITYIYLFSAIAFFILLIACINYMNLATARAARRAREVGMRKVLGAYRVQLIRQFYGESVLLTILALGLGLALAALLLPVFNGVSDKQLVLDGATLRFVVPALLGLGLVVSLIAGSYPALFLSSFRPVQVLKGRFRRGSLTTVLRKGLVVFQFGVSAFLIVGTLVVVQQLRYVSQKNLGLDDKQVMVVEMNAIPSYTTLVQELKQHSGVLNASITSEYPGHIRRTYGQVVAEGMPTDTFITGVYSVSTDRHVIETLGLDVQAGGTFSANHVPEDGNYQYILNEAAVREIGWTPEEAIGKWFNLSGGSNRLRGEVVGVVNDFHFASLRREIDPLAFYVFPPQYGYLMVRISTEDVSGTLAAIEQTWKRIAPSSPFDYSFLDHNFDALYRTEQRMGQLFGAFAFIAILIACLGLFGLAAYSAEQRTKEIGVRKVLGASASQIVLLLSKEFTRLVLIAFVVAAPVAYLAMNRWLDDFAYRIEISWPVFVIAALIALAVALLTVSYQSIKAALTDPVKTLRYE